MVLCFAPTCNHYSERDQCTYFVFPKDKKVRQKWIRLIRRKDREPSQYSRICSCHFVNGDRKNGPTIFKHNVGKLVDNPEEKTRKKRKEEASPGPSQPESEAGPSGLQDTEDMTSATEEEEEDTILPHHEQSACEVQASEETEAVTPKFPSMLEAENLFLQQEIDNLKKDLEKLTLRLSFQHIENKNHLINVYTGLPTKEIFLTLFSLFENLQLNYFRGWQVIRIPKIDQLLLTLMKLKLNLHNDDLAARFGVSRETVANIFKTWLYALHETLFQQLMQNIPSRNKNKLCMPTSFSPFTNCRIIIDCTEVTTVRPANMELQRSTYSSYKHRNTLKGLVGVAPNGVVTFASKLYPGSTSDKKITDHCGVLKKMRQGDLVLADRGFLISDLLPEGVSLNVPPFLTTAQFTPEQIIRTRTIAKARIHVERAIRRIKSYTILNLIPATLIPHASVVFQVCAALTNLQFPLIREVEHLYN